MFKMIFVPTDGSSLSEQAINVALRFAKETGARLIVLSVAQPYPFSLLSGESFSDERSFYDEW